MQFRLATAVLAAGAMFVVAHTDTRSARFNDVRIDALRRAEVRWTPATNQPPYDDPLTCRFVAAPPTGTSAKFNCELPDGRIVKVKYGRNPEIYAETAATRLLTSLGYPADEMRIVSQVRCQGCPLYPFFSMQVLWLLHRPDALGPHGDDRRVTVFESPAVEQKFQAPSIATDGDTGWGWWELQYSKAPRADLDALRLLAIFLAHWDNKPDNQRLVCADAAPSANDRCEHPVAMIQDLGATFGPYKANLASWQRAPIWSDRRSCVVSMKTLPFQGATFPDTRISEEGRLQLADALLAMSDDDVRRLFRDAKFGDYYSATDDERDLDAWVSAFHHRVLEIATAGPCPGAPRSHP